MRLVISKTDVPTCDIVSLCLPKKLYVEVSPNYIAIGNRTIDTDFQVDFVRDLKDLSKILNIIGG